MLNKVLRVKAIKLIPRKSTLATKIVKTKLK